MNSRLRWRSLTSAWTWPVTCLGLGGDRRLLAGPRPIIERRQRTQDQRPLDTALNGLMVRADRPSHLKKGWLVPVDQQHPRPLDPARRLERARMLLVYRD